ncbi:MAG: hypothetical protein DMF76_18185 [Acidobacteria bacterium]|nr:MAG: hypothetical protein DMF76_18185 [Acidobacteriota bacterium]
MNRPFFALLIFFLLSVATYGQSVSRARVPTVESATKISTAGDRILAARTIAALRRLEEDVITYRSLGDFEAGGKLAQVRLETFQSHLQETAAEVESMLGFITNDRLKMELRNALASYRDGAFWWERIYQPRVVHVSAMNQDENRGPADTALLATVPYTVAIHWRQAAKYLKRAEQLQNER